MTYFRGPLSDDEGPITHPSQVDDSIVIGAVPPTRVACDQLPADSPWKRPGQVCAPSPTPIADFLRSLLDRVTGAGTPTPPTTTTTPPPTAPATSSGPSLLVLAALGGAGYYLLTRKKRA